jgi:sugar phosphate isomerase/epimerase
MEIAIGTCFDYSVPMNEMIPLLAHHGLNVVSIGMHRDHCPVYEENGMESFQSLLDQNQVQVHSVHIPSMPGLGLASSDFEEKMVSLEIVKKGITDAGELRAQYVILHATTMEYDEQDYEHRYPIIQDSLAKLLDYAGTQNVKIAVENLFKSGRNRIVKQLMNDFDSEHLGICFDTSHANLTNDPFELLRDYGDRLLTTHISDNRGEHDDHLLPYEGEIDWVEVVRHLKSANPVNPLLFEPETTNSAYKDPHTFLEEFETRAARLLNLF